MRGKNAQGTTNRTILELKHPPATVKAPVVGYQSHHTGIETDASGMSRISRVATNRTILELKLILYFRHQSESCYQSHHTGIETH